MNLTTKQENEILQVYHAYWDNYIKGDVEAMHPLLADEYTQVGSAESEVFFNKKDAVQFLYDTIEQVAGKLEMRNRKTILEQQEHSILIHEFCDLYALADGNWIFYSKFRASSLMQQKNDSWKIIHQHSSFPDTKTEDGQNISIDKIAEENLQLREAIKRRTVELEQKNRELEIETSLERVRAEAMGMKKPDDILAICKVMFTELQSLGFSQLRNTLINFWDDDSSSLIDYDYSDETGGHKAILSYSSHPVFEQFQKKIKNSQDAFAELVVTKDDLESWKQRRRDSGEYEDPRLNQIDALYYYFYSIGVGAIGISTFKSITDEQLNILKRFRNVFDFAYRRYADVTQAEAQAREAQIQLALERVRARSMAMHKSEELADLSLELVKQVQALGVATWFCAFNINDEDPNSSLEWGSNGQGTFPQYRTPREGVFLRYFNAAQNGETFFINEIGENECPAHYEYLCSLPGVGDQLLQMKNAGIPFPASQIDHVAFFKYGYLLFITYEPVPEAHEIFMRFAKVFEQTYTRFLDLQKAETQAREAKIEAALEKVRSRSLAMHKSDELSEVIAEVQRKFQELDISMQSRVAVVVVFDKNSRNFNQWVASPDFSNIYISTPYFQNPILDDFWSAKEGGVDFYSKAYSLEVKNSYFQFFFENSTYENVEGLEEQKKWLFEQEFYSYSPAFEKNSSIGIADFSGKSLNESDKEIIKRFAKVFEQAYVRFLDLQKAEAQAREAQIEAALERVRSRSMGMQKSEELKEVIKIVYQQLRQLNIHLDHAGFVVDYKPKGDWHFWIADEQDIPSKITHPYFESVWANQFNEAKEKDTHFFATHLNFEEKNKFYKELLSYVPGLPEASKDFYLNCPGLAASTALLENVGLYIENFSGTPYTDDENNTLLRFGKVFQQTYTRFLDLQKAEAQAREAQIEAALERVRSRSMAMHKSDELLEAGEILFLEMQKLGIESLTAGYVLIDKEEKNGLNYTPHPGTKKIMPVPVIIPHNETIHMQQVVENWKKGDSSFIVEMDENETIKHQTFIAERSTNFPLSAAELIAISPAKLFLHNFYFKEGYILIVGGTKLSAEQTDIMLRFAKVFQQTYTRFLDLQKAEAQAREAKIEAALEKARARTMGMQSSDELPEVANVLFLEVQGLGIPAWSCGYNILAEDKTSATCCMSSEGTLQTPFKLRLYGEASFAEMGDFLRSEQTMLVQELGGKALEEHYAFMKSFPDLKPTFDQIDELGLSLPTYQINHLCKFTQGFLLFITYEKVPDSHDIFKRFTKVFEQTYTRFLDLKKAEAQAREAQINLAVERVRARALAMFQSEEILYVVHKLKEEIMSLDIPNVIAATIHLKENDGRCRIWDITSIEINDEALQHPMDIRFRLEDTDPTFFMRRIWGNTANYFVEMQDENDLQCTIQWLRDIDRNQQADETEQFIASTNLKQLYHPTIQLNNGRMGIDLLEKPAPEIESILEKMGAAFDLAYTRFLDLQKAESQARQAKIETALEKVRARALAMQEPEELTEVAKVLRHEMGLLGVEELETCSIFIHDETMNRTECWYALKDSRSEENKLVSDHFPLQLHDTWVGREMKNFYSSDSKQVSIVMQGANRKEWINYCETKSISLQGYYGQSIPDRTYHLFKFSHGAIGAASAGDISSESWDLLQRAASVFSLAYSRFKDLTQARFDLQRLKEEKQKAETALSELQTTQKQLIQSEKMASLGELTAGIAHEIQNPLNFVNNFSDVSTELIDEMNEEIAKGNLEDAKQIAEDLKQNLEKINHHGKRAGDIVKGMLQHSRSSSATKEPTNINKLADEYLRLAYHGLRAKDKSFNATLKTDFDETIGNINIIPQDIGRVILNLITNAFYVVNEKSKQGIAGYEPTVSVSTKKANSKIEISVKDNGKGIPDSIKEKIFQPFFTTKPTGQGTGLGLSLSYDIVKAHGGEMKVETKEGERSEFIIQIPIV
ncbi:ATP-binding protein [Lacibacter sp. H407]|uniref:ATP-binding protein n=1 Tax=Lacibacter sp. H407 TaxID=3133423 RepID=UPI0030BFA320